MPLSENDNWVFSTYLCNLCIKRLEGTCMGTCKMGCKDEGSEGEIRIELEAVAFATLSPK